MKVKETTAQSPEAARPQLFQALRMLLAAGAGVAFYVGVFTLKRQVAPGGNVLAECLMILIACIPAVAVGLALLHRKSVLNLAGAIGAGVVFFFAAACFWLTVPAIFDRSVTLYLINLLDSNERGLTKEEIRGEFIHVYFTKSKGIEKRLNEQLDAGRVVYGNGRYRITDGGRFTISVARVLSRLYSLDSNIVERKDGRKDE
ncbi:MAG: hypothetical protein OXF42_05365 [Candidatus Dadabacteria bacterium]|nr:hypothetical protein [Candidatus Dadabacteria bacterium]